MVIINVPYIRPRHNSDGSVRYYWIRPGCRQVRLPDDEDERIRVALDLNREADAGGRRSQRAPRPVNSKRYMAYWIKQYRLSEQFAALSTTSKRIYEIELRRFEAKLGRAPAAGMTTLLVRRYLAEHVPTLGVRHRARAVIRNVFDLMIDHGYLEHNPMREVRLKGTRSRSEIWTDEEIAAFLVGAGEIAESAMARSIRLGFLLLLYTGQRVGDVLKMKWGDFDGEFVKVVQQKTGRKVDVYCHTVLRAELENARKDRRGLTILTRADGSPLTYQTFAYHVNNIRRTRGLAHLQSRDLRRTAATNLAIAGNDLDKIASVTGHSLKALQTLVDVYIVKGREMSRAAVTRLEDHRK